MTVTAAIHHDLGPRVQGDVLSPASPGYDEARAVWNGMVDRRPALILRAITTADVAAGVVFARAHGLALAIKAGGHNVAGLAVCDDGLVIDLADMTGVRVDPVSRVAHVQPGVRWGQLDRATQEHGLATTGGVDSRTGVAGLTLGGGNGFLARRYGLASDNLIAADVVTADGEVVRASEDEHPDLFWALRGGGGNVGVVTSFAFRLHPVGPEVATVQAFYRYEHAGQALRTYRDLMADAPETVSVYAMLAKIPQVEPFDAADHGQPALAVAGMYAGPSVEAEPYLEPFARLASPVMAGFAPMQYADLQSSFDAGTPDGARYHYRSQFLAGLTDEAIDALLANAGGLPGPYTMVGIEPMGGATARQQRDATAFAHRDAAFNLGIWGGWDDPSQDEAMAAWARGLHDVMRPYGTGGVYVNYLDHDEGDRVPEAYGSHLARLAAVKREWDPENVFRGNHNVTPAAG